MHVAGFIAAAHCRIRCIPKNWLQLNTAGFVAFCTLRCMLEDWVQLHIAGLIVFGRACCNCTLQDLLQLHSAALVVNFAGLTAFCGTFCNSFCRINCTSHSFLPLRFAELIAHCRTHCNCTLQNILELHFAGIFAFCMTCCGCTLQDFLHFARFLAHGRLCILCNPTLYYSSYSPQKTLSPCFPPA